MRALSLAPGEQDYLRVIQWRVTEQEPSDVNVHLGMYIDTHVHMCIPHKHSKLVSKQIKGLI